MQIVSALRSFLELDVTPDSDGVQATRRSNLRRLRVFSVVFLLILLPGLVWNFLRAPEYRATARVQFTAGIDVPRADAAPGGGDGGQADVLTQVQVLTSRPLLDKVARVLASGGFPLAAGDPAAQLQAMIGAEPVEGTGVIELQAIGPRPELLAAALNTLIEQYKEEMKASFGAAASEGLTRAREEAASLSKAAIERRARLDAFRAKNGMLSSERDENDAVARMKGLSGSLSTATEKLAVAEARLRALKESIASGKWGSQPKDDPTLAGMETRLSQLREEYRDLERTYTPAFLNMDPRARAQRSRITELERQIESQRAGGQQAALAAAQEEVSSARATAEQLQAQITTQRASVQNFSQRFVQAKALEDDLAQIEKAGREALERLTRMEANEHSRLPSLSLVEAANVPQSAFRPDYVRDGLSVLGLAFGLGLLSIWFVELFNRQPPAKAPLNTTVIIPQPWGVPGMPQGMLAANPIASLPPAGAALAAGLLPGSAATLRELRQDELAALLAAAPGEARDVVAVLLLGLSTEEALALRRADLDAAAATLEVGGAAPRTIPVPAWLLRSLTAAERTPDAALLQGAGGAVLSVADVQSMLACAAFDGGLANAAGITPEALRHTCTAWLVRQGLRFSDLAALVGRPNAEDLSVYAGLAPAGPRKSAAEIDVLMPALRSVEG
ncbi:tyrosine-type recombinase/integrase [Zoogloea sp. LCSB751]|uniref:tyrosine-type recombinase/integrase n=1 Tax=Zoogloea sp. LCSB751 TaxID=1965277 RepID=UPI0009A4DEFB|nr:tyrosine-type recombinase/integrase [Zoogloea sp. LCSB751]